MFKDILLTIDLEHDSSWRRALPVAVAQSKAFGARLHVLTVVPDYGLSLVGQYFPANYEDKLKEETTRRLHQFVRDQVPDGISVQHCVGGGRIYDSILDFADRLNIDLIVMAAHRPELRDYLLGPNAARVVRHAKCSVLVVRE